MWIRLKRQYDMGLQLGDAGHFEAPQGCDVFKSPQSCSETHSVGKDESSHPVGRARHVRESSPRAGNNSRLVGNAHPILK